MFKEYIIFPFITILIKIYILSLRQFKISFQNAKRSFYRSANNVFGKICIIASDEVIIQFMKSKFIPAFIRSRSMSVNKIWHTIVRFRHKYRKELSGIFFGLSSMLPYGKTKWIIPHKAEYVVTTWKHSSNTLIRQIQRFSVFNVTITALY